jgi:hypothetical protein
MQHCIKVAQSSKAVDEPLHLSHTLLHAAAAQDG